jgi:hypothetical protein
MGEWVNRRNEEQTAETDEKKQNDRLNGRITETGKKAIKHFEIWMFIKTRSKPECVFMS